MNKAENLRTTRSILSDIVLLVLMISCLFHQANAQSPPKVLYIGPEHQGFWQWQREFMQEAAKDLHIDLQMRTANNRAEVKHEIEQLVQQKNKPDYLIHNLQSLFGPRVLSQLEKAGIKSFLINAPIATFEQDTIGQPREKFKLWLGHMLPDERVNGWLLADQLIKASQATNNDKKTFVLAVTGIGSSSAKLRDTGLEERISASPNVKLRRSIKTKWGGATSRIVNLIERYPEIKLIWAASDRLALEASTAAKIVGKTPGKDLIIGGVDGSLEGLEGITSGELHVTLGGHFMEGAWALILINDYHFGHDFHAEMGLTIHLPMHVILADNAEQYKVLFDKETWQNINFKKFSKHYNPELKQYTFSLEKVFSMM